MRQDDYGTNNDALTSIVSQINPRDQVIISDYDKGLLPFLGDFLYALHQLATKNIICDSVKTKTIVPRFAVKIPIGM